MGKSYTNEAALRFPELVIGLVSAVGTDTDKVLEELKTCLTRVNYQLLEIRLIDMLRDLPRWARIKTEPLDVRYETHMNAGNEFRSMLNKPAAIALLGTASVAKERTSISGDRSTPVPRTVYVLRTLKRPEEVSLVRDLYGHNFFALAAYSSKSKRTDRLAMRIASSRGTTVTHGIRHAAE